MGGSLESLLKYTRASAGDAVNDHDAIATVRPADVYAVAAEIKRLQTEIEKFLTTRKATSAEKGKDHD